MTTAVARVCGVLSLAASALHAGLVDEHLREWWGYGLFFIVASVAQGVYGLVLLALPSHPTSWEPAQWRDWRVRLYAAGIIGNGAVLVLYTVTRTVGIPFFGPAAGEVEPVDALGLMTKGIELLTVLVLAWLLQRARAEAPRAAVPA